MNKLDAKSIVELENDGHPSYTRKGENVASLPWRILCRVAPMTNPFRTQERWYRVYLDEVDSDPFIILHRHRHYLPDGVAAQVLR